MRVVFEKEGWQIISQGSNFGSNFVSIIHEDCSAYDLLKGLKYGCAVCSNAAPDGMHALVALYNWGCEESNPSIGDQI